MRPGMIYGRILRSPHAARARRASIASAAQKRAGREGAAASRSRTRRRRCMFPGEEIGALVAARHGSSMPSTRCASIKVECEVLPALANVEQAMAPNAPQRLHAGATRATARRRRRRSRRRIQGRRVHRRGRPTRRTCSTHTCARDARHACASGTATSSTAWVSTQAVHGTREDFAQALKIPQANVRVITEFMGGGFGSKFGADTQGLICARLAKAASAPVKLMLDRKEEHLDTGNRPSATARQSRPASRADGKLTAFDAETWGTGGAGAGSDFPLPYIYVFPNRRRTHTDVYINAGQQRAMRAPGHPQGCFVTEVLMDELADRVRMDPMEFRIKNLPPHAPNAMWAKYLRWAPSASAGTSRHVDRRSDAGADQDAASAARSISGAAAGTRPRAHCEITSDGSVVDALRHAGHRHRQPHDHGDGRRRRRSASRCRRCTIELGDSNHPFSAGSGGIDDGRGGDAGDARRPPARRAMRCSRRIAPQLGVDGRRDHDRRRQRRSARRAKTHVAGRTRASCSAPCRSPSTANGSAGLSAGGTSGVQFAEVEVDIETGITQGQEDRRASGLRPDRRPEDRRDASATAASSAA